MKELNYKRWWFESNEEIDLSDFSFVITCEPHIEGWRKIYPLLKNKISILAMQQSLFWTDERNESAKRDSWLFDHILVWGQMQKDMCLMHDLSEDKITVTGNPRFDKYFKMKTRNDSYTLILGGRGEIVDNFPIFPNAIYRLHPSANGYKLPLEDFDAQVANANEVVFRSTGCGIVAMILEKPVMILEQKRFSKISKIDGYMRYVPSSLYDKNSFGTDLEYVNYAVGDFGATERVKNEIQKFSKSFGN